MKSTTYIVKITKQKNERYLCVGRNPVTWSSPRLLAFSTKNFRVCLLKSVLPFLINQAA